MGRCSPPVSVMAVLAALSVMAGLDPATHANAAIEEEHGRSAPLPAPPVSAWMPASRAGMTDGSVLAAPLRHGRGMTDGRCLSVLAALSVMAGLDPATHANAAIEEEHGRSAPLPAPPVSAWMPATRAGMTDGSASAVLAENPHPYPSPLAKRREGSAPFPAASRKTLRENRPSRVSAPSAMPAGSRSAPRHRGGRCRDVP